MRELHMGGGQALVSQFAVLKLTPALQAVSSLGARGRAKLKRLRNAGPGPSGRVDATRAKVDAAKRGMGEGEH